MTGYPSWKFRQASWTAGFFWLLACIAAGTSAPADVAVRHEYEEDYELQRLLVDTIDQIERNYVTDLSRRELIEAAIQGIIEKLDPYSNYIPPGEIDRFRTAVESEFGGIGIQITMENGQLRVLSPLVGTPAYRAGLLAGDRITHINGESAEGLALDQAVERLKGPPGTSITLTVVHAGQREPQEYTIEREVVHVETVLGDRRRDDDSWDYFLDREAGIGYVRLSAFSRDTPRELRAALAGLKREGLQGLILDLRFNPGGLLSAAIEVTDLFLREGAIVSTNGRNVQERSWEATASGTLDDFPLVVLVNRFSASASEIVAAALQDHGRAAVVGERTWGKGSVQNVIEMEEGRSALKLTTASYRRPSGENIHRFPGDGEDRPWGVVPDEGLALRLSERELVTLVRQRRERDVVRPPPALAEEVDGAEPSAEPRESDPAEDDHDPREGDAPGDPVPDALEEDASTAADLPRAEEDPPETADDADAAELPIVEIDAQLRLARDHLVERLAE